MLNGCMDDSSDIAYQFYIIGEYYQLQGSEDSEAFSDITTFFNKMMEAIGKSRIKVPLIDIEKEYDCAELDVIVCIINI